MSVRGLAVSAQPMDGATATAKPTTVQTPAWVTSQVLPAVNGKAYPIR